MVISRILQNGKAGAIAPALRLFAALICTAMSSLISVGSLEARAEIVITDASGREVHLMSPAKRIVFNDSLLLISLALIDPHPFEKIAGWAGPRRIDQGIYAEFKARFPQIDAVPDVGAVVPANASPETIMSVQPDLFVVNLWQPGWDNIISILDRAGVPVIFLDGPANTGRDPAEATAYSIELLGKAAGRSEQATAYTNLVRSHYRLVIDRLHKVNDRPGVLIDAFAGTECCSTPGRNNRLKQNLELAGGRALGTDQIAGYEGRLNPEAVLGLDPDIYIGTGVPRSPVEGGLVLGGGIAKNASRTSLDRVVSQGIRRELRAVREGRAYAVNHQISISALSVLTFECFAKWTHPDLFADIDPAATLAEISTRFLPVPFEGTFWVGLRD